MTISDAQLEIEKQLTQRAEIQDRSRRDRRPYIAGFFSGLGILIVVLALIGAIWHYNVNSDNQARRQMEVCMSIDGTWINGNTCVPPRASK